MNRSRLLVLAAAGLLGWLWVKPTQLPPVPPPTPVKPAPTPPTKPAPKPKPRRPWGELQAAGQAAPEAGGKPQEGGRVSPDGAEEIQVDLPESERKRNVGGSDGAGLCVFTSIEYAGRWQHEKALWDFQQNMRQEPGGGYPEKVDRMMAKYAAGVLYAQSTAKDWELVKAVLASGRMACVDYDGHDCHYSGGIAHMVCLAHATDKWVAVSDNNFTKENQFVWMSPDEFKRRWGGWLVWLMAPPPPPVPRNAQAAPLCKCGSICQCGAICPCGGRGQEAIGGPVYQWRPVPGDGTQAALFLGETQIGNYSYAWKVYRPLLAGGAWGEPTEPPLLPPGVEPPTGVIRDRIGGPAYSIRGRAVSRQDAFDALESGTVPDDKALPYLTVVGTPEQLAKAKADLDGPLSQWKPHVKVNLFTPDEWQAAGVGLTPGIYLQSPDGRVISRTPVDAGTARTERLLAEGLRVPDPNYDPSRSPDLSQDWLTRTLAGLKAQAAQVPPAVWVGAGLVLLVLLTKGK